MKEQLKHITCAAPFWGGMPAYFFNLYKALEAYKAEKGGVYDQ
jgi:hypothetical protein